MCLHAARAPRLLWGAVRLCYSRRGRSGSSTMHSADREKTKMTIKMRSFHFEELVEEDMPLLAVVSAQGVEVGNGASSYSGSTMTTRH